MAQGLAQLVRATAEGVGAQRTRAAARLMTRLENEPERLPELFVGSENWPQPRLVLGVTGAPGSGKSTLADALVAEYRRRHPERRVGVIAVDPSSPFTGGAVLGDRVRMMRHATDPLVFVRSMASRGHLGGLTLGVRGVLRVLGLIGCELVLVETVGVGQSEVEVAKVADLVLIVLAPGQGDSIQLLKAGLMEIGDVFAVNKADRPGAAELHAALLSALQLDAIDPEHGWHQEAATPGLAPQNPAIEHLDLGFPRSGLRPTPEVFLVSSLEHTGLGELSDALEQQTAAHQERWQAQRKAAVQDEITDAILEEARARVAQALGANGTVAQQVQRVLSGEVSVKDLARELLRKTCAGKQEDEPQRHRGHREERKDD